jgi:hypothetical protein
MGYQSVVGGISALDTGSGTSVRPCQPAGRFGVFQEGFGVAGRKFRIPADALADYPPFTALPAHGTVSAGPVPAAAAKNAAIQSPCSSTNPLFFRETPLNSTPHARSLRPGGSSGVCARDRFAVRSSLERADRDDALSSRAGWRSPRRTELKLPTPVCGTSEWCKAGADPDREGSPGCLNLRLKLKTVFRTGTDSEISGRIVSIPLAGVGDC